MIELSKEEVIQLLEQYYKDKEGREVKVYIQPKLTYDLYGNKVGETDVYIIEEINLGGLKKELKETISRDTVKDILNSLLMNEEYYVNGLSYLEGYRGEAYFNGITLYVCKKRRNSMLRERSI